MAEEEKSEIAKALEERAKNRPVQVVDGLAFTGPGDKIVGAIAVRVGVTQELAAAIAQSDLYLKELSASAQGAVDVKDPDLAMAARTVHLLHAVCRNPKDPNNLHAFTTPREMMRLLTRDEVAKLLDIYNRWVTAQSPFTAPEMDVEREVAHLCLSGSVEFAELELQSRDRQWLERFVARMAFVYADRLKELEMLRLMQSANDAAEEVADAG